MATLYKIGKQEVLDSDVDNQVKDILNVLKTKKQTYAVNKFVLEKTIEALFDTTF